MTEIQEAIDWIVDHELDSNEEAAQALWRRDTDIQRAAILAVCQWLEERHQREAATDIRCNITDPGQPFEHFGLRSLENETT